MNAGPQAESRPREKIIMMLTITTFYALAVVPGLDHRFGWSQVQAAIVVVANLLIVAAFALFIVVLRANTYAAFLPLWFCPRFALNRRNDERTADLTSKSPLVHWRGC